MLKKLLVPLDRSSLAEQALGQAAALARAAHADIDLVLVHAPSPFAAYSAAPSNESEWNAEHEYLEATARELESGARVSATHTMMRGAPADLICSRARDADLVVMTSHGRTGFSRAWLGSVADAVVRHSPAPVLILRPSEGSRPRLAAPHPFKSVLVALDNSALALEAIGPAVDLARASNATLVLLHVVAPVPLFSSKDVSAPVAYAAVIIDETTTAAVTASSKQRLNDIAGRVCDEYHLDVVADVVVDDRIADGIIGFARGHSIDVIVMATHGRGASRLLLGSVADKVIHGSGVAVMLLRPANITDGEARVTTADIAEEHPALSGL